MHDMGSLGDFGMAPGAVLHESCGSGSYGFFRRHIPFEEVSNELREAV
jgi:hypothetical protein